MAGSSEKINYRLRPAKHIERKMLGESFRKLSEFGLLESYRYIGFGSFYFADFSLFHRMLGISNMISIERDMTCKERFLFNRPFGCIDVLFGECKTILPTLAWDVRTIAWLDYDGVLDKDVMADVGFFAANAIGGSMLIVSVNCQSDPSDKSPTETLKRTAGWIPNDVCDRDLAGWGKAAVYKRMLWSKVEESLTTRNGIRPPGNKYRFKQILNFRYSDGAKMLTFGGLIYDEGQSPHVAKCSFETLEYYCQEDSFCLIEVPKLTFKEVRHLDAQLPRAANCLTASAIPAKDLERYAKVYRYFPAFAEADL